MVCHHLCLLTTPIKPPLSCVSPLWHTYTLTHTHTYMLVVGGVAWLAKEARLDQRPCVRGVRVPHRKQLPLAVSASHPGLTAARNMRPLQTSVLGKKKKGQDSTHTLRKAFVSALSHSPSLTQTYKEERKPFVYAHSLIQPQKEIFVSHIHSLCHPHKTIKLSHAWFLFIVCLLNSFISCFSQFGAICLSILLCVCLSLLLSPALIIVPVLSVT